jgi:hypothetical protein
LWLLLRAYSFCLMSSPPDYVHERQAPQVQRDVADARGSRIQVVEHLGELRHRDEVELATKRDQRRAAVRVSLDAYAEDARRAGEAENPERASESRKPGRPLREIDADHLADRARHAQPLGP